MNTEANGISDFVIDALSEYTGFSNWWFDLDDETQDDIKEALEEDIQEFLDGE